MEIYAKQLKRWKILAVLACALGFAGCGEEGEGGKKSDSRSSGDGLGVAGGLMCFAVLLTSGDDSCVEHAVSGSSGSGSSGSSTGGNTSTGGTSTPQPPPQPTPQPPLHNPSYVLTGDEIEPNDDLINAMVPRFPNRTNPDDQTGWSIRGWANDISDTRDAYAFTPRREYMYRISLCPPGERACENHHGMDTLTLFWRLLDQDGNEITSSQGSWSNKAHLKLDAGLLYYVVVDAGDTMGATVEYKIAVLESR